MDAVSPLPAEQNPQPLRIIDNDATLPGPIFFYDVISSSLDVARSLVRERRLPIWGSLLARSQTGGRGQMRRPWNSPPGNVYATLRLPTSPPLNGTAAAPAIGALLAEGLGDLGLEVQLKWPNDLVVRHRGRPCKLGGILLEEYDGSLLAGIGINLTSSPAPEDLRRGRAFDATHIAAVAPAPAATSPFSSPEELWNRLVRNIYFCYAQVLPLSIRWRQAAEAHLLWRGSPVTLTDNGMTVQGVLLGLGPSGGACLQYDGRTEEFLSGSLNGAAGTAERP